MTPTQDVHTPLDSSSETQCSFSKISSKFTWWGKETKQISADEANDLNNDRSSVQRINVSVRAVIFVMDDQDHRYYVCFQKLKTKHIFKIDEVVLFPLALEGKKIYVPGNNDLYSTKIAGIEYELKITREPHTVTPKHVFSTNEKSDQLIAITGKDMIVRTDLSPSPASFIGSAFLTHDENS